MTSDGRVAVVTGGAMGIGYAIASRLARAGYDVAVADIDSAGAERVAEELRRLGRKAVAVHGDVGDRACVLRMMQAAARAQIAGILAGATLIAAVGILDDRGLLHHQVKLFVGMPLAAVILMLSGVHAQVFAGLVAGRTGLILDLALTFVWVVGVTASFSILDHMDGLCAGVAATAAAFFALIADLHGQALVTVLAAAVLGAAAGLVVGTAVGQGIAHPIDHRRIHRSGRDDPGNPAHGRPRYSASSCSMVRSNSFTRTWCWGPVAGPQNPACTFFTLPSRPMKMLVGKEVKP